MNFTGYGDIKDDAANQSAILAASLWSHVGQRHFHPVQHGNADGTFRGKIQWRDFKIYA